MYLNLSQAPPAQRPLWATSLKNENVLYDGCVKEGEKKGELL